MIDLLILLLVPALRFLDAPKRNWWLFWAPLPAWLLDVFVAHTSWALVAGYPKKGEYTVSQTLERLCLDEGNQDHALFWQIGLKINRASGLPHISVVVPNQIDNRGGV